MISPFSEAHQVMRTRCERCGLEGYIFPDQVEHGKRYAVGDWYWSKCCDGRKSKERQSKCLYLISGDRAMRLQKIRRRKTDLDSQANNF